MDPVLEHLPLDHGESFFASAFDFNYFETPWHYHPEYEIVLVAKSSGKRFVGNSVSEFREGDLSFFGPNLPHLYKNPPCYYANNPAYRARSIVIHFKEESIGKDFLSLPQSQKIISLFERSKQGIDIIGETRDRVVSMLKALLRVQGMDRLIKLLEILCVLADTKDFKLISAPGIVGSNILDTERLDRVFQYILKNYDKKIDLSDVAMLTNMTRTSFCRFFKERTKRNFSSFLIDVRLDNAAKLLVSTNKSVTEIGYSCGYNNISNFNKQFREKFNLAPREYRSTYSHEIIAA